MKSDLQLTAKKAQYEWNANFKSPVIHTDIKLVIRELKELSDTYGELTPALLVEASKNKKALLHNYFEWDDGVAAEKWRIRQAASMLSNIEVTVIREEKLVRMQAYQVQSVPFGRKPSTYTKFDVLTQDNHIYIYKTAMRDLQRVKNKLEANNHKEAIPHINKAIQLLRNASELIPVKSKK